MIFPCPFPIPNSLPTAAARAHSTGSTSLTTGSSGLRTVLFFYVFKLFSTSAISYVSSDV